MMVVITGEKGEGTLTRQGLEEYVSDCVIFLDKNGISILPVTSLGLTHRAPTERTASGIPRLDEMLGGKGYFKGSTVLVSGTAGTGKTSVAALLAKSTCGRGEKCLFFAFGQPSMGSRCTWSSR